MALGIFQNAGTGSSTYQIKFDGTNVGGTSTAPDVTFGVMERTLNVVADTTGDLMVEFDAGTTSQLACVALKILNLPINASDASASDTGTSTTPDSTAVTLTQTDEMVLGFVGTHGPSSDAAGTWDTTTGPWTAGQRVGTNTGFAGLDITVSEGYYVFGLAVGGVGFSTAAQKTGITSRDWVAGVQTYK